jgi:hypothetical protein
MFFPESGKPLSRLVTCNFQSVTHGIEIECLSLLTGSGILLITTLHSEI